MPNPIPFSLGLNPISVDSPIGGEGANAPLTMGGGLSDNSAEGSAYGGVTFAGGGNVSFSEAVLDGYFNADSSLKQIICPMTLFQSFPVETEDGSYTRVTDLTSTSDGAGTDLGSCVQKLNGGRCGYPDNATESVLDMQINGGVENFRVGAAIALPYIEAWLKRFFPEVTFKQSRKYSNASGGAYTGGSAYSLISEGCLCAEVVFPTSNTSGVVRNIKFVSFAPMHEGPRLDIMPAFCLIKDNLSIFKITALSKGRNTVVDGSKLKFMFQDCKYDWSKGEIIGYGPKKLKQKLFGEGKSFDQTKVWRQYVGGTAGGPTGKNGFSIIRLRFFIDPNKKEKAEKILKCSIPDELMKGNYSEGTIGISEIKTENPIGNIDNSSIAGMILNAGTRVSEFCVANKLGYNQSQRTVFQAPGGSNMKYIARGTDCSSSVWWILLEAGLLKESSMKAIPNTAEWRTNLSKHFKDGIKLVPVDVGNIQPGDIIMWDRGKPSNNHIAIYAAPGKCFDFGSDKRVKSPQPGNKSLTDRTAVAGLKIWRAVSSTQA